MSRAFSSRRGARNIARRFTSSCKAQNVGPFAIDAIGTRVATRPASNTGLDDGTRADEGWLVRGGLLGELPLTTRLALQARAGAALEVFPESAAVTWEGQLGFAVY